jgi:hypothetical protein
MTAIQEIHELTAKVKALESELATLRTAKAQATAQASTPNTSGPFTTRAQAEAAYCSLPDKTLADARVREAFRKTHRSLLGL